MLNQASALGFLKVEKLSNSRKKRSAQECPLHTSHFTQASFLRKLCWPDLRVFFYFVAEHDRFGNFFHRLALLAALPLEREIGLLLGESEIALQNSLGALDDLARLELLRKCRVCVLEAGHFDFCTHEKSDSRDQANFAAAVDVMLTMLEEIGRAHV